MSAHSPLSPSARYRWSVCPASVRAIASLPEGESGAAAIDGTHTHTVLECTLKAGPFADPKHLLGMVLTDHEGKFTVDQDRIDRVKIAMNYIGARVKELGLGTTVISERRVSPKALIGREDMDGTVDVQLHHDNLVEIIDYKDGMNDVPVIGNKQLEQYALAVLSEKVAKGDLFSIQKVRLTIIQPKLAFKGQEPVSWVEHDATTILGLSDTLMAEAAATDVPDAPFVPGQEQCKYCPYAGRCAAHAEFTMSKAGMTFKPTSAEPQQLPQQSSQETPSEMTDERLREIIESAPMLKAMIEAAETEALNRIQAGHAIAGLKAIRGSGRREWALPDEEVEKKLTIMHVPKDLIWRRVLVSAPQALAGLKWTKRDGKVEELSPLQLERLEKEFVRKTEGKLSVVPEADKRPAVTFPNLEQSFGPVSEDAPPLPSWLS